MFVECQGWCDAQFLTPVIFLAGIFGGDVVDKKTYENDELQALSLSKGNEMFEKKLFAGWADIDSNSHMRNTVFLDKSADVRMMFFSENGFPASEFMRLKIGPVVMKDEMEYYKEIHLLDEINITLVIAGLSQDGSRFSLRNEFFRSDGKMTARVTSTGGWLDLSLRKLVAPPKELLISLQALPKTEDYKELNSSVR